jgi:hypothetical protein
MIFKKNSRRLVEKTPNAITLTGNEETQNKVEVWL